MRNASSLFSDSKFEKSKRKTCTYTHLYAYRCHNSSANKYGVGTYVGTAAFCIKQITMK